MDNGSKISPRLYQQEIPDCGVIKVEGWNDSKETKGAKSVGECKQKKEVKNNATIQKKPATVGICSTHQCDYVQLYLDPDIWGAISIEWTIGEKTLKQDARIFDEEIRPE